MPEEIEPPSTPIGAPVDRTIHEKENGNPIRSLLKMKVYRKDEGLIVEMQSDLDFADRFKNAKLRRPSFETGGVPCIVSKSPIRVPSGTEMIYNSDQFIGDNGEINFSLLMADNLRAGVRFVYPTEPLSGDRIRDWARKFQQVVREIYACYIKDVEMTVELTLKSSVKETIL